MIRISMAFTFLLIVVGTAAAQAPSYSKDIRPFLAKYCVDGHNAKTLKGTLNLETYKALMEGADAGAVVKAGKPDESKLVLMAEHKDKPFMPPAKAKFQPTKAEIKLLRAWVAAGARDDGAEIKVELPVIKAKTNALSPVTAICYEPSLKTFWIARKRLMTAVIEKNNSFASETADMERDITAMLPHPDDPVMAMNDAKGGAVYLPTPFGPKIFARHTDTVLDLAIHSKTAIASAGYDSRIHLLKREKDIELKEHSDAVYGLAFNPDGTLLASVSADRAMKVWDVEKGKLLYTLGEATDWLYTVAWSPNGKYLVSGGVDKSIRVYEPTRDGAKLRQSVFAHEGPVQKVLFSSDSKTLYSVGQDRVIKAWDVDKMVERKVYDKQPETVLCMALREDAGQIIIGRYDGIVQLIDMKTGKVAHEFGKEKPAKPRDERSDSRGSNSPQTSSFVSAAQTAPTKIDGVLDRAGAVDTHRVKMDKGQQLGVQVVAEGKAKFEPVLTIADAAGQVVADSSDGHLGHTFAAAGMYTISVRDRDYRGGPDYKYQLRYGEIPILTAVFPMGLQRGTTGDIQLDGVFLPRKTVRMTIPADAKIGDVKPLFTVPRMLGKPQIVVGEFPEVATPGEMPIPGPATRR